MATRDLYEKACLEWALKHTDLLFNSEHYIKKYPMDIHEDEKDEEDRAFDLDQGHFYDDELYHWHNILCEADIKRRYAQQASLSQTVLAPGIKYPQKTKTKNNQSKITPVIH